MKIAVTGASGFIGTELLNRLSQDAGIETVGLTRGGAPCGASPSSIWRSTDYSVDSLTSVLADVDAIVHLAAVRGTTPNREDYVVNDEMTANLLDAIKKVGASRIVFASTISVYDDVTGIPWGEDYKLEPRTMYGDSKIACERMIQAAGKAGSFEFTILRIAQVLGLGEKRRGMMNVFLDTAAAGGQIKVMGRSEAKRQYILVDDLVDVMARAAEGQFAGSQIMNIGMPNAYTNLEIAQLVNKVYDNETPINYDDSTPETIRASHMNTEKLEESTGLQMTDMEDALRIMKNKMQ